MIVEKQKARATLLGRRKRAIIISLVVVTLLAVAFATVNYFVKILPFTDVDGTEYQIKIKNGEYKLFDKDGNMLDVEDEYGYYVTKIGTLVELDAKTGVTEIIAAVDVEGSEELGHNNRVLMFPHLEKKDISSVEVHNSTGDFRFIRYNLDKDKPDNDCEFVIESSPLTEFDAEMFTKLHVSAGYTLTTRRIEDPIKDASGEFSEYGLVPEERVDEEGNSYEYTPAYYVITDMDGTKYKVLIGDMLPNGGGYYVQYVELSGDTEKKRESVYVLDASIADSILQPIESFVTPRLVYQMSMSDYNDVEEFGVFRYNEGEELPEYVVGFSYVDLADRKNTVQTNRPYKFTHSELSSYIPNSEAISDTLYYFYSLYFEEVCKLSPKEEDFLKYGLYKEVEVVNEDGSISTDIVNSPKYVVSFYYDIKDANGKVESTIKQVISVSDKNENGNFYAYTTVYEGYPSSTKDEEFLYAYDMIVEVEGHCFDFLTWDRSKWINNTYVEVNIAFCDKLTLETKDYSASFDLDNSKTPVEDSVSSSLLTVLASDSKGNSFETFSTITVTDKQGFVWTITANEITAVNSKGESSSIEGAYYAYNALDKQARCLQGYIDCADGIQVRVTPDKVSVKYANGTQVEYVRFATDLFRRFYQTLTVATIVDSYTMTEEEEKALIEDESKLLLTMTLSEVDGETRVYKFYKLTSRKAYITINGLGGFYVMTDRVEKIASDAQKFFAFEMIDSEAKH